MVIEANNKKLSFLGFGKEKQQPMFSAKYPVSFYEDLKKNKTPADQSILDEVINHLSVEMQTGAIDESEAMRRFNLAMWGDEGKWTKQANLGARAIIKGLTVPTAGGLGIAGGWDALNYGNPLETNWDQARRNNFIKNFLVGGLGTGTAMLPGKPMKVLGATEAIYGPILTNNLIEGVATQKAYQESQRNSQKNIFEKFNELSPKQKTLAVAATGLTAALAVPALINISAAAKRLADGRAVRLSTSIRKRRNQDKDLVIGVEPVAFNENTVDGEGQPINPPTSPQESKGFLSKIFG